MTISLASRPGTGEAELESSLVDVEGTNEARDASSRFNASASGSPVDGTLPASKLSILEVTKCSPSTISNGSK